MGFQPSRNSKNGCPSYRAKDGVVDLRNRDWNKYVLALQKFNGRIRAKQVVLCF
jgi:hypothetical protein